MRNWAWGNVNGSMDRYTGNPTNGRRSVYKAIPTDHWEAHTSLINRRGDEIEQRSIGYATCLTRGDDRSVRLIHHRTAIVVYYEDDSVRVTTGGYYSATTKARLNAALSGSTWSIGTVRGVWYWYRFDGDRCARFCEYADGDRVYLAPGLPGKDGIFCDHES